MKYEVYGHATVVCSMVVEADGEEEAIEIANKKFGGLINYAGMGSCNCLVGVITSDNERYVYPDSEVEFDDAQEIG